MIVLTSVILACTNLPKEIESRVIYTIVTKPTTPSGNHHAGKIVGFSRIFFPPVLLIMGLFTWTYLRVRAVEKNNVISIQLRDGTAAMPIVAASPHIRNRPAC